MLIRPFACWSSDSGTVSGTSPVEAGEWKATAAPPTAWRRTSSQTCAWPLTSRAPIVERTQKLAESEAIITRRRGRRSATTPPTRSVHTCASVQAAKASPTSEAELLRPRIANATAIGARLVPKNEIVRAENSNRKLRRRRTAEGPGMNTDDRRRSGGLLAEERLCGGVVVAVGLVVVQPGAGQRVRRPGQHDTRCDRGSDECKKAPRRAGPREHEARHPRQIREHVHARDREEDDEAQLVEAEHDPVPAVRPEHEQPDAGREQAHRC